MPITEEMRVARRQWVGASDVAAIMGVSPYATAADIWAEKLGMLEPDKSTKPWIAMGNRYEAGILAFAEEQLGTLKTVTDPIQCPNLNCLRVIPDAIVASNGHPVDAKMSGIGNLSVREQWGEAESGDIPQHYILQITAQAICCRSDIAHLAALIGDRGEVIYHVARDAEISEAIIESVNTFWHHNVQKRIKPEGSELSPEVVRRLKRVPGKTIEGDRRLLDAWMVAREYRLQAEKAEDGLLHLLVSSLGDAEGADFPHGQFTYLLQKRKGYAVEPTEYRVPKFKTHKGE